VLGGSIPLGIATHVSDIDLLVLLAPDAVFTPAAGGNGAVFFAGTFGQSNDLATATAVIRDEGLEFDLHFIPTHRVVDLLTAAKSSGITFSMLQRQLLSRLRNGWLLAPEEWPIPNRVLRDESFDIHCAMHSLVTAYRSVVDAQVALQDDTLLARMMGRHAIEKAFDAYFASQGFSALGLKWLRFLRRHLESSGPEAAGVISTALASRGRELLLPSGDAGAAKAYVSDVEQFVGDVRSLLERRMKYRVAFQLSRHLAQPRVSPGGAA
jgi:hypothetical protein